MKTSLMILAGAAIVCAQTTSQYTPPIPTVTAAAGSLPLGATCSTSEQCANGADCYSTNSGLYRRCGNFQASCKDDSQCAYNTCNLAQGLCNGFKATTTSSSSTTQYTPPIPTVTAAVGSLPLGATCSSDEQCSNGASCYSTNSGLIRACGNFQAVCKDDSQCAFNTCNQGFCNGFKATTTTAASSATSATSTAAAGSLPLGASCSSSEECSNGAECWASNFMLMKRCGNFQATCKDDSQCAFNPCNGGVCVGFKPTTALTSTASATLTTPVAAAAATSTVTSQYTPPIPTVTAAAGSLALGATCSNSTQCANGANCYATNSGLIPRCGNFQASCSKDSQCAYNTCNNGFCNGFKPSTSSKNSTSSGIAGGSRSSPTPSGYTVTPSTGGAVPASGVASGVVAVAFGMWAFFL
ncbi:uncharacterized protein K489DRAFT_384051 [Dissoconium aciculare CBS 342.82]|uniref:Carbohydrate-binding module family 18 protein n=1 Tax=Dissoconium aciculare CBS 342.82 TaxID=1314786 RepID=A0A6J3LV49_9PEZI|nr:uncharacterized protein K489DRAFT_384051 [Dissoconium aciculare CBS 342.82]KAF1819149.1 hypothetical protein K489DRAFT_384051 [Dissoconium aciculare CBS 342.82]